MSMCNNIICEDCNEFLWIGQSHRLYTKETYKLEKFFEKHEDHLLRYVNDNKIDLDEIKDFEESNNG